mgnify:CR=1 FL=1
MTEFITASEAAELWGLGESTLRSAIHRKRFKDGECKKPGRDWFVKVSAMKRLYGEVKSSDS